MPQHRLCHFEIGNDAILERAHRHDIAGRSPQHPLRFITDCQNLTRTGSYRYNRRLTQHNPMVLDKNQRVSRAQINADVI
jgi:hypothetical protein